MIPVRHHEIEGDPGKGRVSIPFQVPDEAKGFDDAIEAAFIADGIVDFRRRTIEAEAELVPADADEMPGMLAFEEGPVRVQDAVHVSGTNTGAKRHNQWRADHGFTAADDGPAAHLERGRFVHHCEPSLVGQFRFEIHRADLIFGVAQPAYPAALIAAHGGAGNQFPRTRRLAVFPAEQAGQWGVLHG